jgi:ABC-type molybdenum transport system ATPase subunit/photorepair protein PhrA
LYDVWNGMNDFRQIMYNDKPFTPKDFNTEYEKCLTFVKEAVKKSTAKHIVVATHHVPSAQCVISQLFL